MKIQIVNMRLLNFKGVRDLNIDFGKTTNITGENGTGKTSIVDGFTWCMFGKNSEDAKDFNIKTLDKDNNPIHKLDHEVTVTLDVDGREYKFRRTFKEKWVKKRGEAESEFTGHETAYFVDDVPLQLKEYQARVDMVMNENIAKMITSPTYFNSLKWQDRRGVLEAMAGTISNDEIAGNNLAFRELLNKLGNEKLVDFKKKIASKKTILKQSLDTIPTRINEAERNKPQVEDWNTIEAKIDANKAELDKLDEVIQDRNSAYEIAYNGIRKKQQEKFELETKLQTAKQQTGSTKRAKIADLQGEINSIESEISGLHRKIESINRTFEANKSRIASLTETNAGLRQKWIDENSKALVIDEHALNCPTCKQALPEDKQGDIKATLTANFNSSKKAKLDDYDKQGRSNKETIEQLTKENEALVLDLEAGKQAIEKSGAKLKLLAEDLQTVKGWPENASPEVEQLQKELDAFVLPTTPTIDISDLKAKKQAVSEYINALAQRLANKAQIEKLNARICELQEEETKQAQELADLERIEFTIAEFGKAKIETIENRINGKFSVVKFKMFEQQINGGETECCECMVNGVPYSDVNTAGKINAGIDIINALTEHYNISAPVFIDNRESIIRILPCKSQIINLIAMKDQPLTISVEQQVAIASN